MASSASGQDESEPVGKVGKALSSYLDIGLIFFFVYNL